jgi:malate dehydrogenase (oxaloacetate-decarboxylating)
MKSHKKMGMEDKILRVHKGGKIGIKPLAKLNTLSDLRMVYTPGVAQVCGEIVRDPLLAKKYTSIGNTVCIATNGSAVLGLGNIGVLAGMPVMEGKSLILNKMVNVDCVPILIDSNDAGRIVDILAGISSAYSLIMIEDIEAPLCFEVEEKLQKKLSIPVFHDDQHGTATVILAGLIKALKITKKSKENVRIVINGAGAAGMAAAKMLLKYGFKHIMLCDRKGAIYKGREEGMNSYKADIANVTNQGMEKGALKDVIKGKDIFIGVSTSNIVTKDMVKSMNKNPVIFALANPVPEIWPEEALEAGAAIAVDGRTLNNCVAFPGIIRGALSANSSGITYKMKIAAAEKIAALSGKNEVVPDFMNLEIHKKISEAVKRAA